MISLASLIELAFLVIGILSVGSPTLLFTGHKRQRWRLAEKVSVSCNVYQHSVIY